MPILARRGYLLSPIRGETMPLDALGVCDNRGALQENNIN
jgi:hypothetical protein